MKEICKLPKKEIQFKALFSFRVLSFLSTVIKLLLNIKTKQKSNYHIYTKTKSKQKTTMKKDVRLIIFFYTLTHTNVVLLVLAAGDFFVSGRRHNGLYAQSVHVVLDLGEEHIVDHLMLSHGSYVAKLARLHVHGEHGAASARDVEHVDVARFGKTRAQHADQLGFGFGHLPLLLATNSLVVAAAAATATRRCSAAATAAKLLPLPAPAHCCRRGGRERQPTQFRMRT